MNTNSVSFLTDKAGPTDDRRIPAAAYDNKRQAQKAKPDPAEQARLQNTLSQHGISLEFSQDDTTKSIVVRLVDEITGDEIRQIPSEVSLRLAASFIKLQGQFLDTRQ